MLKRLKTLVNAGTSIIAIETAEVKRCRGLLFKEFGDKMLGWDMLNGLVKSNGDVLVQGEMEAIDYLADLDTEQELACFEMSHRLLEDVAFIQKLLNISVLLSSRGKTLLLLGTGLELPKELRAEVQVVDHVLPDADELRHVLEAAEEDGKELDDFKALEDYTEAVNALTGLSTAHAEQACAVSLTLHGQLVPSELRKAKAEVIRQHGALELTEHGETFADLGGLQALKDRCKRLLETKSQFKAKGIMLLGVPGTGKSAFAKALGNETGRATVSMNVAAMFGSLVGQTEQAMRSALQLVDRVAPCVLFIDEIEKALSGTGSSGQTDGGTTARVFGNFLTWLNDHETDVFVIATCNNIKQLPPEFTRAERWDGLYFVDLPDDGVKTSIWDIYIEKFIPDHPRSTVRPNDKDWTGAEIRSCCRTAAIEGISLTTAAESIVPVATTAAEPLAELRTWAAQRCLSTEKSGRYTGPQPKLAPATSAGGRKINKTK